MTKQTQTEINRRTIANEEMARRADRIAAQIEQTARDLRLTGIALRAIDESREQAPASEDAIKTAYTLIDRAADQANNLDHTATWAHKNATDATDAQRKEIRKEKQAADRETEQQAAARKTLEIRITSNNDHNPQGEGAIEIPAQTIIRIDIADLDTDIADRDDDEPGTYILETNANARRIADEILAAHRTYALALGTSLERLDEQRGGGLTWGIDNEWTEIDPRLDMEIADIISSTDE